MVGFDLMVEDGLAGAKKFFLGARLRGDGEVDGGCELLRQFEVDNFVLALEGGLQEVLDHVEGFVDELPVVLGVYFLLLHWLVIKL